MLASSNNRGSTTVREAWPKYPNCRGPEFKVAEAILRATSTLDTGSHQPEGGSLVVKKKWQSHGKLVLTPRSL